MNRSPVHGAWPLVLALLCCLCSPSHAVAPGESGWAEQPLVETPVGELAIRLVPLTLEELASVRGAIMADVRENAETLADVMIQQARLAAADAANREQMEAIAEQLVAVLIARRELVDRARAVLNAVEAKGGDAAADRAYLEVVAGLLPDLETTFVGETEGELLSNDLVLQRVDELVEIVRAEPPAHRRAVPWEVPLSEFSLELQPLSTEQLLERLDEWRAILQVEVRNRIRIDILLNDSAKLEESLRVRNEGARLVGMDSEGVSVDELRAALAERAEVQQQVITAIVDRMRVAIELAKRRGESANEYVDYIASATGRKLNFTDFSVLRVQVAQWLNSSTGGRLIAWNAFVFVAIAMAFWLISRFAGMLTRSAVRRIPRASSLLGPVLAGIVQKVLLVVGLVVAASAVGVDTGPLLATIGAAGLVIGLALQGTLSNFASGILILLNRPFDIGDVVDAGGVFGKVSAMNLVSTTILTFDNQLMLVPNNQIWNTVITNATGKKTRRGDLTFGIAYDADITRAVAVLEEVLGAHPKTLADPAPIVRVNELADSSVNLIARPWVRTTDYWDVYWDLMREVKERFDREGIGIPFPQRDLHVPGTIEVKLAGEGQGAGSEGSVRAAGRRMPGSPVREVGPDADDGD